MQLKIDPTVTGGTAVDLSPASASAGKLVWATPDHSRHEPRLITMTVSGAFTPTNGVGRTGVKIDFRDSTVTEGCCDVTDSYAIADVGFRMTATASEALVDEAIDYLRAVIYTTEFVDAVKRGLLAG